jgi:tripartite-type tricarboxylate transporter receptor subunit TctC
MKFPRRDFLRLAASAATLQSFPRAALAEDVYPSRPVHLIVGFTPGAASDIIGRLFAQGAGPLVGQEIVVENKPGAGSGIAAQYVARAAKDGYTLFLPALSTLTNEIINPSASFDLSKDFAPIALLAIGAVVLVVNPATNVHSVSELIALAKSKPGPGAVRLDRHGQSAPACRRVVCSARRPQADPRALSGQPTDRRRSDRRPHHHVLHHRVLGDWPDCSGPSDGAGDGVQ